MVLVSKPGSSDKNLNCLYLERDVLGVGDELLLQVLGDVVDEEPVELLVARLCQEVAAQQVLHEDGRVAEEQLALKNGSTVMYS